MEVAIVTKKVLECPQLEMEINLETGASYIKLTYRCQKCAGYGCGRHGSAGKCDDGIVLKPETVLSTIGEEGSRAIVDVLSRILNKSQ